MTFAIAQAILWFGNLFVALIVIRAVLSWLPASRSGGGIVGFVFVLVATITEPFVMPIRKLLHRSPIGNSMVIDIAPMITMILMRVLTMYVAGFMLSLSVQS